MTDAAAILWIGMMIGLAAWVWSYIWVDVTDVWDRTPTQEGR